MLPLLRRLVQMHPNTRLKYTGFIFNSTGIDGVTSTVAERDYFLVEVRRVRATTDRYRQSKLLQP